MTSESSNAAERVNGRKALWVFTPSRTDPEDLEFILVQRHKLLEDAVERVSESALTDHKHHLLFVGPRGCGKTHLATLIVSRLSGDDTLADRLRIAWLSEDETSTTLLEFLLKIHASLEKRYPDEFSEEALATAYDMKQDAAQEFVANQLLASLGARVLLVVAENLDAIFEGLGSIGQKQLRAFIQENSKLSLVATAQRLVEDLSSRASPFFGFFQTEHLKPLNVEEATELLQNIARLNGSEEVVMFLASGRGRSRVRALHHLSGGNHRVYIVLSQFITRDSIDALLGPFMKMVDELTPYYQERVRWLPPLQRKIVEYLCSREGTVPVKEIAKKLFATPQTISRQLQDLREKGYVESNQRGRESLYEISEPLMRICVEVKENQSHQPLRLLVDFLRVWYDDVELKQRLDKLDIVSSSRDYLEVALQRNVAEGSLRKRLFLDDLKLTLSERLTDGESAVVLQSCADRPEAISLALKSWYGGNSAEAILCLDEAIKEEADPIARGELLNGRAELRIKLGESEKAIEDFTSVIELADVPVDQIAKALYNRGCLFGKIGKINNEFADYTALVVLAGVPVRLVAKALFNRAIVYQRLGEGARTILDYTSLIELPEAPNELVADALINRGVVFLRSGEVQKAISDFSLIFKLESQPTELVAKAHFNRGVANFVAGNIQLSIEDLTAVIDQSRSPIALVAKALLGRGVAFCELGEHSRAIQDCTGVIDCLGASRELVATALYRRGVILYSNKQNKASQMDFEMIVGLQDVPNAVVAYAHFALSDLYFGEGRWNEGFRSLKSGLEICRSVPISHQGHAIVLIGTIFSAGLGHEDRKKKLVELLGLFGKYRGLSSLGEAVVAHIGNVYRTGKPFPSTDNLESWATAWEQAAESEPDFGLSVRLLRTGVDYVKAGGSDAGILLDLTIPERAILEQAFGIAET